MQQGFINFPPGPSLRQPVPTGHLRRGLQATVRLLQRRPVRPRERGVPLPARVPGGQVPGAVSLRALGRRVRKAVRLSQRGHLRPDGRVVRLPGRVGRRPVSAPGVRRRRAIRTGVPARLLLSPEQHRAVSFVLNKSYYSTFVKS